MIVHSHPDSQAGTVLTIEQILSASVWCVTASYRDPSLGSTRTSEKLIIERVADEWVASGESWLVRNAYGDRGQSTSLADALLNFGAKWRQESAPCTSDHLARVYDWLCVALTSWDTCQRLAYAIETDREDRPAPTR